MNARHTYVGVQTSRSFGDLPELASLLFWIYNMKSEQQSDQQSSLILFLQDPTDHYLGVTEKFTQTLILLSMWETSSESIQHSIQCR